MHITIALCLLTLLALRPAGAERVTIYRDEWGVPHIYAQTEEAAAYGLGWAQAEDRLEQLLKNYRLAAGTMAEVFGEEWIERDWQQRFVGHEEVSRRHYRELPAKIRAVIEAYQQGVKDYMKKHPEQVPSWAPSIEPWQVVALGRYIIFNWPMGRAVAELQRRGEVKLPFSSNQWAVRPERTAEGCAILLIDPHIPWDNEFRFYEFRLHGGELHLSGFGPLGAPLLGLGHNRYLGWAATTGGPDTTDIYVEEVNPNKPLQYRYEGKWRNMQVTKTTRVVGEQCNCWKTLRA
ncbi:MAG: penicillin acylase family protein [Armatimonadota bacterium]